MVIKTYDDAQQAALVIANEFLIKKFPAPPPGVLFFPN